MERPRLSQSMDMAKICAKGLRTRQSGATTQYGRRQSSGEHRYGNQSANNSPHPAEHDHHDNTASGLSVIRRPTTKGHDALPADRHHYEIDCGRHEGVDEAAERALPGPVIKAKEL
jgi:hypothetical protein